MKTGRGGRPPVDELCPRCDQPCEWDGDGLDEDGVPKSFWWCEACRLPVTVLADLPDTARPSLFGGCGS